MKFIPMLLALMALVLLVGCSPAPTASDTPAPIKDGAAEGSGKPADSAAPPQPGDVR